MKHSTTITQNSEVQFQIRAETISTIHLSLLHLGVLSNSLAVPECNDEALRIPR